MFSDKFIFILERFFMGRNWKKRLSFVLLFGFIFYDLINQTQGPNEQSSPPFILLFRHTDTSRNYNYYFDEMRMQTRMGWSRGRQTNNGTLIKSRSKTKQKKQNRKTHKMMDLNLVRIKRMKEKPNVMKMMMNQVT